MIVSQILCSEDIMCALALTGDQQPCRTEVRGLFPPLENGEVDKESHSFQAFLLQKLLSY